MFIDGGGDKNCWRVRMWLAVTTRRAAARSVARAGAAESPVDERRARLPPSPAIASRPCQLRDDIAISPIGHRAAAADLTVLFLRGGGDGGRRARRRSSRRRLVTCPSI